MKEPSGAIARFLEKRLTFYYRPLKAILETVECPINGLQHQHHFGENNFSKPEGLL